MITAPANKYPDTMIGVNELLARYLLVQTLLCGEWLRGPLSPADLRYFKKSRLVSPRCPRFSGSSRGGGSPDCQATVGPGCSERWTDRTKKPYLPRNRVHPAPPTQHRRRAVATNPRVLILATCRNPIMLVDKKRAGTGPTRSSRRRQLRLGANQEAYEAYLIETHLDNRRRYRRSRLG